MGCVASSKAVSPGPSAELWWQPWRGQSTKRWWPRWACSPDRARTRQRWDLSPCLFSAKDLFNSLPWSRTKSYLERQANTSPSVTQLKKRIGGSDSSLPDLPEEESRTWTSYWGVRRRVCIPCKATWKGISRECSVRCLCSATHYTTVPLWICSWAVQRQGCCGPPAVAEEFQQRGWICWERSHCHQAEDCLWGDEEQMSRLHWFLIDFSEAPEKGSSGFLAPKCPNNIVWSWLLHCFNSRLLWLFSAAKVG